ncbi:MAG: hypothetical protein ACKO2Z_04170, partial [Sphaerospermopsis kisseleviana]
RKRGGKKEEEKGRGEEGKKGKEKRKGRKREIAAKKSLRKRIPSQNYRIYFITLCGSRST